jgi:hypothetical protein
MTIKPTLLITAGLLLAVGGADAQPAARPSPPSQPVVGGAPNGRFQVVNGLPEYATYIMLLDTMTGETWMLCRNTEGDSGWCKMPRFSGPPTRNATKDSEPKKQ